MINYSELTDIAHIWVYTSNRFITTQEQDTILIDVNKFLSTWSAHGDKLKAASTIVDNCFLLIGIDEESAEASGCSIDASVTFIQKLEKKYNISLLDWQNMAYQENDKTNLINRAEFVKSLKENKFDSDISIYNTNLSTKLDFNDNRIVPILESKYQKFLPKKS